MSILSMYVCVGLWLIQRVSPRRGRHNDSDGHKNRCDRLSKKGNLRPINGLPFKLTL
jgi:hypothetical protein